MCKTSIFFNPLLMKNLFFQLKCLIITIEWVYRWNCWPHPSNFTFTEISLYELTTSCTQRRHMTQSLKIDYNCILRFWEKNHEPLLPPIFNELVKKSFFKVKEGQFLRLLHIISVSETMLIFKASMFFGMRGPFERWLLMEELNVSESNLRKYGGISPEQRYAVFFTKEREM